VGDGEGRLGIGSIAIFGFWAIIERQNDPAGMELVDEYISVSPVTAT
jgi:hypothetical protein